VSVEPTRGPFRNVDGAWIRRRYWALARRVHDHAAARGDAIARTIEHGPGVKSGAGRPRPGTKASDTGRSASRRGSSSGALLADEVAIDFPSMSPIVARMRDAFLPAAGDHDVATRRAEVELTARQADQGVRVPLDFTVRHTCPACGGRGELWTDPCGLCDGSGAGLLPHRLHFRVPPGVRDGTRLRYSVTPPHAFETHIEVRIAVQ